MQFHMTSAAVRVAAHTARSAALLAAMVGGLVSPRAAAEEMSGIYVMRVDGSGVRRVVSADGCTDHGCPCWSHDGRRLAFHAQGAPQPRSCYVVNLDGSGLAELSQGRMPDWSPDDKQIVYQANAAPPIFVQNLDNTGRTQIATGYSPRWDPLGERLAISDRHQLRVLNLLSGEEAELLHQPHEHVFDGFEWSSDGRRLALVTRRAAGGPRELGIVETAVKNPEFKSLVKGGMGGSVAFSPDGKEIVYSDGWKIHVVAADGSAPPRLVPGQKGLARQPAWSPDGKWIAFAGTREDSQ